MDFSASYRDASGATSGHNYELEVTVSGRVDPETGMVIDLKDLKELMAREVEARFDHRSLSDDTSRCSTPPSRRAPCTASGSARPRSSRSR